LVFFGRKGLPTGVIYASKIGGLGFVEKSKKLIIASPDHRILETSPEIKCECDDLHFRRKKIRIKETGYSEVTYYDESATVDGVKVCAFDWESRVYLIGRSWSHGSWMPRILYELKEWKPKKTPRLNNLCDLLSLS